jgi:hypothetical protein
MSIDSQEVKIDLRTLVEYFVEYFSKDDDNGIEFLAQLGNDPYNQALPITTAMINTLQFFTSEHSKYVPKIVSLLKSFRRQLKCMILNTTFVNPELDALDALALVFYYYELSFNVEFPDYINELCTKYTQP